MNDSAASANKDLACRFGVGAQQSTNPHMTQVASEAIVDGASTFSRQAGVIGAAAQAATASASPLWEMKKLLVQDGRLTLIAEIILGSVVIFGLFGIPFFNVPFWLAIIVGVVALLAGSVLMFEGRATALGLKPFSNDPLGWRKAKQSYKPPEDADQSDKKDVQP